MRHSRKGVVNGSALQADSLWTMLRAGVGFGFTVSVSLQKPEELLKAANGSSLVAVYLSENM